MNETGQQVDTEFLVTPKETVTESFNLLH